jgi:hypothetical protein
VPVATRFSRFRQFVGRFRLNPVKIQRKIGKIQEKNRVTNSGGTSGEGGDAPAPASRASSQTQTSSLSPPALLIGGWRSAFTRIQWYPEPRDLVKLQGFGDAPAACLDRCTRNSPPPLACAPTSRRTPLPLQPHRTPPPPPRTAELWLHCRRNWCCMIRASRTARLWRCARRCPSLF